MKNSIEEDYAKVNPKIRPQSGNRLRFFVGGLWGKMRMKISDCTEKYNEITKGLLWRYGMKVTRENFFSVFNDDAFDHACRCYRI